MTMRNLVDAFCDYGEADTVIHSKQLRTEYNEKSLSARYNGIDVVDGSKITIGDKITRLGSGWTHVESLGE